MPENENEAQKLIREREHIIYKARVDQLLINILGLNGGRPYVEERLSRFAGESKIDWEGGKRTDGTIVTGRMQQAHSIPNLGRIAGKINQYVLGKEPEREGITTEVQEDITTSGESVDVFMSQVNSLITACRWCWIGIDAPVITDPEKLSKEEKEKQKIRPYWTLYRPTQVVDWYIDKQGIPQWVLTDTIEYEGVDPHTEAIAKRVRALWEHDKVTKYFFKAEEEVIESEEEIKISYPGKGAPFVPAGLISAEPYAFDDLESINRTMMDLESCNRQNFFNAVFPQMKVPVSLLDTIMEKFSVTAEEAVSMIIGLGYPIFMEKDDAEPGYIMPDAAAIGTMREELKGLKKELFDTVGLLLQQETRQVASAESKAWDFLDIQQVMTERSRLLEDAEGKASTISHEWDSDFPEWKPVYNKEFDVANLPAEIKALIEAGNVSMPDKMTRFVLKKLFDRIKRLGTGELTPEEEAEIVDAIEAFSGGTFEPVLVEEGEE